MLPNTSILSKNELTIDEQFIYNAYLIASRRAKNQPVRLRKDFSNIKDEVYIQLKKLGSFFETNKNIPLHEFFWAPYEAYSKDEFFDLGFYTTRKAIVAYTRYMHKKETQDADSDNCINDCKQGLKTIYNHCILHKSTLQRYKLDTGIPAFLLHLKEHKINFYILHGLEVDRVVKNIEQELLDFYCKDFYTMHNNTRVKFISSKHLKEVIRKGLKIIEEKLLIFQ
jgi:hypothetical protein